MPTEILRREAQRLIEAGAQVLKVLELSRGPGVPPAGRGAHPLAQARRAGEGQAGPGPAGGRVLPRPPSSWPPRFISLGQIAPSGGA